MLFVCCSPTSHFFALKRITYIKEFLIMNDKENESKEKLKLCADSKSPFTSFNIVTSHTVHDETILFQFILF